MVSTAVPSQNDLQIAIVAVLEEILPADVDVVAAVANRVPEPASARFVVISVLRYTRLRTNIDSDGDCKFTGSIAGTAMTVTAVDIGAVAAGATVYGQGVSPNTTVVSGPSGGGPGSYIIEPAQTVASTTLSAGQKTIEQGAQVAVQLDFHSADNSAADLAQTVSTVFRDAYGVQLFEDQGGGVVPLYADDPRYVPWINDQSQYEWRWVLEANFQVNQTVSVPQQYFDGATITPVNVDTLPP